jgi:hypothetical protein
MKLQLAERLWNSGARIIEFGVADGMLADELMSRGAKYLGVVDNDREIHRLAARHPKLAAHLTRCRARYRVRQNNADVLILNGATASHLRKFRDIRHAKYVACSLQPTPLLIWILLFWAWRFLHRQLAWPQILKLGNERLIVFRVRRPRPHDAVRRFIPHATGVEGFFRQLRSAGICCVVLRWFDSLPNLEAGEDLDLLVDDRELAAVREFLDSGPGMQPVDLYSVSGSAGADYQGFPYYPPILAEQLVARSVLRDQLYPVPSPSDHFLSLAYHALYHKGEACGVPRCDPPGPRTPPSDHDYQGTLRRLAQELEIESRITLDDLDECLEAAGWRPREDVLQRLARRNRWLHRRLKSSISRRSQPGIEMRRAA